MFRRTATTSTSPLKVPALIVGGGPVGLYASALLSAYGVPSLLVERAPSAKTKRHPRSHYINSRSMELLRELGVEDAVRQRSPPLDEWRHFRYCSSLLGSQIAAQDHAGDAAWDELCAAAATQVTHLSQPKLEAILRTEAERRAPAASGRLLSGYECATFEQDGGSVVRAVLRPVQGEAAEGDEELHVQAEQLLACDGAHSNVRSALGLKLRGPPPLQYFKSVHFRCPDLAPRLRDLNREAMLHFCFNKGTVAVLVAHNIEEGEWVAQLPYFPGLQDAESLDEKACEAAIAACIGDELLGGGASSRNSASSPAGGWMLNIPKSAVSKLDEWTLHRVAFGEQSVAFESNPWRSRAGFVPSETFTGPREGMIFANGAAGYGYYPDPALADEGSSSGGGAGPSSAAATQDDPPDLFDSPHKRSDGMGATAASSASAAAAVPFEIQSIGSWAMSAKVAQRLTLGRVHLLGDAAHQFPPAGAFGANTGLQDAHNLCWKIASVHHGKAEQSLIKTYDPERRQVALANARLSVHNYHRGLRVANALGLPSELPHRLARLGSKVKETIKPPPLPFNLKPPPPSELANRVGSKLLEIGRAGLIDALGHEANHSIGEWRREAAKKVVDSKAALPLLFARHELGFVYGEGDDETAYDAEDAGVGARIEDERYVPSTRVGARLPHHWLDTDVPGGGVPSSTHDLLYACDGRRGPALPEADAPKLTLLIDASQGAHWIEGASRVPDSRALMRVVAIAAKDQVSDAAARSDGLVIDRCGGWAAKRQVEPCGALLVRPDGHIAWRCERFDAEEEDAESLLRGAIDGALGRAK